MTKIDNSTFVWNNKGQEYTYNIEQFESLLLKNQDSWSYKLVQSFPSLKTIFNFLGFKTELEKETNISIIKEKLEKQNINLNEAKNSIGDNLLFSAVKANNIPLMKSLISVGADLNIKGYDDKTALHIAATNGNNEIVKFLLEKNPDLINQQSNFGQTALY